MPRPTAQINGLTGLLAEYYRDNATTLTPDPMHSRFYDSPPAPEATGTGAAAAPDPHDRSLQKLKPKDTIHSRGRPGVPACATAGDRLLALGTVAPPASDSGAPSCSQ